MPMVTEQAQQDGHAGGTSSLDRPRGCLRVSSRIDRRTGASFEGGQTGTGHGPRAVPE
jgi:hypothetical protein